MYTKGIIIGFCSMFENTGKVIISFVLSQNHKIENCEPELLKALKGKTKLRIKLSYNAYALQNLSNLAFACLLEL